MNNHVYVKDLPYDFIKDQPDSFFASQQFSDFTTVFNGQKVNAPLLANPIGEPDKVLPEVLDYLRLIIASIYTGVPINITSELDLYKLEIIRSDAKVANTHHVETKQLHIANKSISDISPTEKIHLVRHIDNVTMMKYRANNTNATSADALSIATNNKLRPVATSNPTLNIVKSSKFYQSKDQTIVTDDYAYKLLVLNKYLSDNAYQVINSGTIDKNTNHLEDGYIQYTYKYTSLTTHIRLIQEMVSERYMGCMIAASPPSASEILKEALKFNLKKVQHSQRFVLYKFNSAVLNFPAKTYILEHNLTTTNFIQSTIVNGSPVVYDVIMDTNTDSTSSATPFFDSNIDNDFFKDMLFDTNMSGGFLFPPDKVFDSNIATGKTSNTLYDPNISYVTSISNVFMDFNVDVAGLIANSIYDLNNVVSVGIVTDFNTTFDNFNGTYTLVALDTIVDSNIGVGAPANWANKDILNTSVITPIDHDVLSIASAYNVNVTTLFLFDTKSDNAIWLKDLYVTKEFAIQKITYTSSMVWYVLVDSISDGLILQIEDTNGNALTPSYTKVVDKNKIEINFSTAKAGNVYVLSGSQNEAVNTDFIITNDNVMNVLSSTDFFTKRFKRWIH